MKYPHLSPSERRRGLWRKCMSIVVRDRQADAEHAAWWIKTNCRHYATPNSDQQTVSNLSPAELSTAWHHLETLRRAGLIEHEHGFRGNFIKRPL